MRSVGPFGTRLGSLKSGAGSSRLRESGAALFVVGAVLVAAALVARSPMATAVAIALTGVGVVCLEVATVGPRGVNPITAVGAMFGLGGAADLTALLFEGSDHSATFFLYESRPDIGTGLLVIYAGLVWLWMGYRWSARRSKDTWRLPTVWVDVPDETVALVCAVVYISRVALGRFQLLEGLGTLNSLVLFSGPIAAFLLTRRGAETGSPGLTWFGIGIALAEAIRAAMFEILRMNMILPLGACALGLLVGTRSVRALRRRELLPVYVLVAVGLPFFGTFGKERTSMSYGSERFSEIRSLQTAESDALISIVARLTTLNQVSQVVRLVDEGGYRRGETLDYLLWVWIPRFVWPEKPIIAKGQWFAAELGQGTYRESGAFSNSVNMTVPGELYLNFGWLGIVLGCAVIGALLNVFWRAADFWKGAANPWGNVLGFYLLYCGAIVIIDLQLVVSLVATYLVLLALALLTRSRQVRKQRLPVIRRAPSGS